MHIIQLRHPDNRRKVISRSDFLSRLVVGSGERGFSGKQDHEYWKIIFRQRARPVGEGRPYEAA